MSEQITPKTCCVVGVGNHSSANLLPALLTLQEEGKIKITTVCRKNVDLGNAGIEGAKVTSNYPPMLTLLSHVVPQIFTRK